ncbi:MAG: polyhydroxyalkanoic acid system family protein [Myxococcales bacterium]|nr:polyhydroxyalkanoic acid system family protein [Myxococcales bacterium]MCB9549860.1 polyhydroxyalkanoic acid system family protein [Myxococcales bacterium]
MADVRVSEPHHCTAAEARAKVSTFEEMMSKYGVRADWRGNKAELKGTGVSGSIDIDATNCNVVVKLGLMARAMGVDPVKLEGSIRKRLQAAFQA